VKILANFAKKVMKIGKIVGDYHSGDSAKESRTHGKCQQ